MSEIAASDRGLQPERTALSWQRTILALGAGGLLLARALLADVPVVALAVGLGSVLFTVTAIVRVHRSTRNRMRGAIADEQGLLLWSVALATSLLGVGGFVFVIVS